MPLFLFLKSSSLIWAVILISFCFLLLIQLLRGKWSPKLTFPLIILSVVPLFFLYTGKIKAEDSKIIAIQLVEKPTEIDSVISEKPKPKKSPILKIEPYRKAKIIEEKPPKKYMTKVQLKGITSDVFLRNFEQQAGYQVAKKADFIIEFSYTGTIQNQKKHSKNRFTYSGGQIVASLNGDSCCCQGLLLIPNNISLGKTLKEANQIMSQELEEKVLNNSSQIISMIAECLPKH